ncbi:MAG: DUF6599 family protein [Candidatus Aminicenantaceae bacterium]
MSKKVVTLGSVLVFSFLLSLSIYLFCNETPGDILPGHREIGAWERREEPEYYNGDELFGYIDGGAEIFLQYGFKELYLSRYTLTTEGKEKEITLEVYRMESPADAFGIFSGKREGDEEVSQRIDALNWKSETQISLVKAEYFVNIVGFDCEEKELEEFSAFVARRIRGKVELPPELSLLPSRNLRPGSETYIKGHVQASTESVLLEEDFWEFKGKARAVCAKYGPSNSKLVIIDFKEKKRNLTEKVKKLFKEYLNDVVVKERIIQAENALGYFFLFKHEGDKAVLITGARDLGIAALLLRDALERIKK